MKLSRRQTLAGSAALLAGAARPAPQADQAPYNAAGERVGEVTVHTAIVHTRLTASPTRNDGGYSFPVWAHNLGNRELQKLAIPEGMTIADLEGACPGRAGRVRLLYGASQKLGQQTPWVDVGPQTDFTHQFALRDLQPDTMYFYSVVTASAAGAMRRGPLGRFRTAPEAAAWAPVKFFVISCQDYACRDHLRGGYRAYESMTRLGADFVATVGDCVYYDLDPPFARSVDLARHHWHRMYSQPLVVELFRNMSGYWLKDDHDSFEDDDWPSREADRVQPMSYQTLAPVFVEQIPMGPSTYRKVRWGKGLEIWFTENRDFRSPNSDPDGPTKTIWGAKQKAWLERTLLASDAQFRVLISPNCIVGPDSPGRVKFQMPGGGADSHGDLGFGHEGREFRQWVRDRKLNNFITINGDRHWQYHSVDPKTGVREFCCGCVADSHAIEFPRVPEYHRFLRTRKGGFLSVSLEGTPQQSSLAVRHHDVLGAVVNEVRLEAA